MGTRERREREKRERREEILRAARRLFWKSGYVGTTMPGIAEAAELAPGTLYLYFPSKEMLYVELLVEGYDRLIALLKKAVGRKSSPRSRAEALIDGFFEFAAGHPEYFDIIFFVVQREGRRIEEVFPAAEQAARLRERQEACKEIAAEVLRGANRQLSDEEIALQVEAVWSMLGGVVLYFLKEGPESFNRVADAAKGLLLKAVFAKG
jgi:AcrR family transcriptional regulator